MIARYNKLSFGFGIPGIILQIVGQLVRLSPERETIGSLTLLVGTVLLMIGLAYYAKAKGRSPAWCLMGFFSLIGLIVLACLKDKAPDQP
jgi:hypothetical protein